MLFHSAEYLCLMVATLAAYWLSPGRWRLWILLAASLVFYASWSVPYIGLIGFSTGIDYLVSLGMARSEDPRRRKRMLALAVGCNLAILGGFKYANFLLGDLTRLLQALHLPLPTPLVTVVLPLGISFYTFEAISYVVDVYRGMPPIRSYRDYALYILFFPHLIAGPIVRAKDLTSQFATGGHVTAQRIADGLTLFLLGLISKCDLADNLAPVVDAVYRTTAAPSALDSWLGMVAFTGQLLFDFAGYTAMARGSALLFGFDLPKNFVAPYLATNVSEFWQRWHISLSSWLRDYVYIPLGGSRQGPLATCRNLVVTMAICGLWHGASWLFVISGTLQGVLLAGHRLWRLRVPPLPGKAGRVVGGLMTYWSWALTMVFFRAPSFEVAWRTFRNLVGHDWTLHVVPYRHAVFVIVLLVGYPAAALWWERRNRPLVHVERPLLAGVVLGLLVVTWVFWQPEASPEFVYFQF